MSRIIRGLAVRPGHLPTFLADLAVYNLRHFLDEVERAGKIERPKDAGFSDRIVTQGDIG